MAEPLQKRARCGSAGLLDIAFLFATQKAGDGRMGYPAEAGAILALCRSVDSRVLEHLSKHVSVRVFGGTCVGRASLGHAARIGDESRVAVLIGHGAPVDTSAISALSWAISRGHTAAARCLLAAGASIPRCLGDLHELCVAELGSAGVAARSALIEELCTHPSAGISSFDAIRMGVSYGVPSLVARHFDDAHAGGRIDQETLSTWFTWVSWNSTGHKAALLLLAARPGLFEYDAWFEIAADLGDQRLVRDICALVPDFDESKALFAACGVGDLELVKSLLARDGNARGDYARRDIVFFDEQPPWYDYLPTVFVAAQRGHVDVVRYILLWLRSKPDHADLGHMLMAAVGCGLVEEALYLIRDGVDVNEKLTLSLWDSHLSVACLRADTAMVRMLLREGADPNVDFGPIRNFNRPLFVASGNSRNTTWTGLLALSEEDVQSRRKAIVCLLLDAGAELAPELPASPYYNDYVAVRAIVARMRATEESGGTD